MKAEAKYKPFKLANGFHSVTQDEMRRILDVNARKLVRMSGDQALPAIQTRKRRDPSAQWATISIRDLKLEPRERRLHYRAIDLA